jgi:TetR/AcrR family transcriptional regulator, transcriptional repressor for nem operon
MGRTIAEGGAMNTLGDRKAETRRRILNAAIALFRRHGVDAVGVDAIMDRAGLTHGGFYGHFTSKEALVAEVCADELGQSAARWAEMAGQSDAFARIVAQYLRPQHAEIGEGGCVLATLGPEVARRREACSRVTDAIRRMADALMGSLPARRSRPRALAALSTLVGAVVLARASSDAALAAEILQAAQAALSPVKRKAVGPDPASPVEPDVAGVCGLDRG